LSATAVLGSTSCRSAHKRGLLLADQHIPDRGAILDTASRREAEQRTRAECLDQRWAVTGDVAEEQHVRTVVHAHQDWQRRRELLSSDGYHHEVVAPIRLGAVDHQDRQL
jgi:hypothetical protein